MVSELKKKEVSNIWSEMNKYFILDEVKNFAWKNIYSTKPFYNFWMSSVLEKVTYLKKTEVAVDLLLLYSYKN